MEYREHRGEKLSAIGLGAYALSGAYGAVDPQGFRAVLRRAFELGVNYYDVAAAYGEAERIVGEALRPIRDRVLVATKIAPPGDGLRLDAAGISRACEASLKALGTDYIDIYQVHYDDPLTPVDETVDALEKLVSQGKIRHYGVSHLPPDRVEEYLSKGHVFSCLMEMNAAARSGRDRLLPLARRYGAGAIAFSVTARGLLTGRFAAGARFPKGDIRQWEPQFQRERFQSGLRIADKLAALGCLYGKSPAQVAIAWVLAQSGVICALCGPSTPAHLEENLSGSGWQLEPEHLSDLEHFLATEEQHLRAEDASALREILEYPVGLDARQAFVDLVCAFEVALEMGLVDEPIMIPLFRELLEWRKRLAAPGATAKLEDIRRRAAGVIRY